MRKTILLSAALFGFAASAVAQPAMNQPAMTQGMMNQGAPDIRPGHVPGIGDSYPASDKASNITPGDTGSRIAPRLPTPVGGPDAGPGRYLADARAALDHHQTGRAQEALERAETAMLDRSVAPDQAGTPDQSHGVSQIRMARDALAHRDIAAARQAISGAMMTR